MANDLTKTDSRAVAPSTRWSEPALPEKLASPLRQARSGTFADVPMLSPSDTALARAQIAAMGGGLVGSSERAVNRMMTRLATAYPNAKLDADESEARIDTYTLGLADIPPDILSEAMMKVIRAQKFFPAIAEIRAAAGPALAKRIATINGLKSLVLKHDLEWREPIADQVTPEQAAAIRAETMRGDSSEGRSSPAAAPASVVPTVDAYLALGLTQAEAAQAVADHNRMMRRGARPIGATAAETIITSAAA